MKFPNFFANNYQRSNNITNLKIQVSDNAIFLAQELLNEKNNNLKIRQKLSEQLLDELSDAAGIDIVFPVIADKNQYHRKRAGKVVMKNYGVYYPKTKRITIANRTAVRGQVLAAKTFVDTLLHEWLHHYDTYKLKLNSIHSKGFYERLNDLKDKLKIPKKTT